MGPDVVLHIAAGATGIVAGAVALAARKGERLHRAAGTVFFAAMTLTAATGALLGALERDILTGFAGVLTLYLLATAWMAARRADATIGRFEIGALVFAALGAVGVGLGTLYQVQAGTALLGGVPGFSFAAVVGLAALADLSVVLRGGVSGRQRIARHLWRMHAGFFIAIGSFFPGQIQFFPETVQQIRPVVLLFIPPFSVAGLMLFWLGWVWLSGRFGTAQTKTAGAA